LVFCCLITVNELSFCSAAVYFVRELWESGWLQRQQQVRKLGNNLICAVLSSFVQFSAATEIKEALVREWLRRWGLLTSRLLVVRNVSLLFQHVSLLVLSLSTLKPLLACLPANMLKQIVDSLVELSQILHSSRYRKAMRNKLLHFLRQVPDATQWILDTLIMRDSDSNLGVCVLLECVLRHCCTSASLELWQRHKATFFELYLRFVLQSRQRPPIVLLDTFQPLLTVLSDRDWKEFFQPHFVRLMKRNPEVALSVWDSAFRALATSKLATVDLGSAFVDPLLMLLLEPLQSKDESLRTEAMNVTAALVGCLHRRSLPRTPQKQADATTEDATIENNSIVRSALTLLWSTLTNIPNLSVESDSKQQQTPKYLPYWYQRVGVLHAVKTLSDFAAADSALCAVVVEWLIALLRTETTKEVHSVALDALAAFVRPLPTLPSHVTAYWTDALCSSTVSSLSQEETRRYLLSSLAHTLHSRVSFAADVARRAPQLVTSLIDRILQCKTKPLYVVEGMLALSVVVSLAAHNPEVDMRLKTERVWEYALGADSFLWKGDLLNRVSPSETTLWRTLHELIEGILMYHWNKLSDDTTRSRCAQFVVRVLLHESQRPSQRHNLAAILQQCHKCLAVVPLSQNLSFLLLTAFDNSVAELCRTLQQQSPLPMASAPAQASVLREGLQAVLAPTLREHLDVVLPQVLLLSHHPLLIGAKRSRYDASRLWRSVVANCLELRDVAWHDLFARHVSSLVSGICGREGLLHPSSTLHRRAALFALFTILSSTRLQSDADSSEAFTAKQLVREHLVIEIARHLSRLASEWMQFSTEDIHIYLTPVGQLYHKVTLDTKSDSRGRRTKGSHATKKNDDSDWEAQLRAERERKKQQEEEERELKRLIDEQMQREQSIRERVKEVFGRLESTLRAVACASEANPMSLDAHLSMMLPSLLQLARSTSTSLYAEAQETLRTVTRCCVYRYYTHSVSRRDTASHWRQSELETQLPNGVDRELSRALIALAQRTAFLTMPFVPFITPRYSYFVCEEMESVTHPSHEHLEQTPLTATLPSTVTATGVTYTKEDAQFLRQLSAQPLLPQAMYVLLTPLLAAVLEGAPTSGTAMSYQRGSASSSTSSSAASLQEHALTLVERHLSYGTLDTLRLLMFLVSRVHSALADSADTLTPIEKKAQQLLQKMCSLQLASFSARHLRTLHRAVLHPSAYLRHSVLKALLQLLAPESSSSSPLIAVPTPMSRTLSVLTADELAEFLCHMWAFRFDEKESDNVSVAETLWAALIWNGYRLPVQYVRWFAPALAHEHVSVRELIANALVAAVEHYPDTFAATLTTLQRLYTTHLPKKREDELMSASSSSGLRVTVLPDATPPSSPPTWSFCRFGVAQTFRRLSRLPSTFPPLVTHLAPLLRFIIYDALLLEPDTNIFNVLVEAGVALITELGQVYHSTLLPVLEECLEGPTPSTPAHHRVRESVVLFMGCLAKHLAPSDPKRLKVIDRLLEVVRMPSEPVQLAIALCLSQLVPAHSERAAALISSMLDLCLRGETYGERRGGAFALAGLVKGLGVASIKKYNVTDILQEAIADKEKWTHRQGALLAFEVLSRLLGRVFEPYVIHILPQLLTCFGDNHGDVRDACSQCARTIMSQLSPHGVKLVLPALTKALEDRSWRTKQGAVQLLGSMAYLQPTQLRACLPTIVPRLITVLTDTHVKVQQSARGALRAIGSIIKNPEIQQHVSVLLKALDDPSAHSAAALDALIGTSFVHHIDAPSLSLIMPILDRALHDPSTDVKVKAAQIVGNMCSLTDQNDLSPYLSGMVEHMKLLLMDHIPVTRAAAARALGSLLRGMGDKSTTFARELVVWLLRTIKTEPLSEVERNGAAQGLAEVIAALEMLDTQAAADTPHEPLTLELDDDETEVGLAVDDDKHDQSMSLDKKTGASRRDDTNKKNVQEASSEHGQRFERELLPLILRHCRSSKAYVRQGFMAVLYYLPESMGEHLLSFLTRVMTTVMRALADEIELVRDTSFKVAQTIVQHYAHSALDVLFAILEKSLFDDNWRVRHGSILILGSILRLVSSSHTPDEPKQKDVTLMFSDPKRSVILSALYMLRSDVHSAVRQEATQVWKTVITNTPKTLRQIVPSMMQQIIVCLSSSSNTEKRQMAGKALGDLVRKLGERVLPEIIPILERGLENVGSDTRQGICLAMTEVIGSASKQQLTQFINQLIPPLRRALCDPEDDVRQAAGTAFDLLYKMAGSKILDEILPPLLAALEQSGTVDTGADPTHALNGLKQMLSVRSKFVLPAVLPKLIKTPLTPFSARALGSVSEVAGTELYAHLGLILPPLMQACVVGRDTPTGGTLTVLPDMLTFASRVVLAVVTEEGQSVLFSLLTKMCSDIMSTPATRYAAATLIGVYCKESRVPYSGHLGLLIQCLLRLYNDPFVSVQESAAQAFEHLTNFVLKDETLYMPYMTVVNDTLDFLVDELRRKGVKSLPGFNLPKALAPLLAVYLTVLRQGTHEARDKSSFGIRLLLQLTAESVLKTYLIQITGPLIRVLSERSLPSKVRHSLLVTLNLLIECGGVALRPFVFQLQTTYVNALTDPTERQVREEAARGINQLLPLGAKVDFLFKDLLRAVRDMKALSSQESSTASAALILLQPLAAISNLMSACGTSTTSSKPTPAILHDVRTTVLPLLKEKEELVRKAAAVCLGHYATLVDNDQIKDLIGNELVEMTSEWQEQQGSVLAIGHIVSCRPSAFFMATAHILPYLYDSLEHERAQVREATADVLGCILKLKLLIDRTDTNIDFTNVVEEILRTLVSSNVLLKDPSSHVKVAIMRSLQQMMKMNDSIGRIWIQSLKPQKTSSLDALSKCVLQLLEVARDRVQAVSTHSKRALFHLLLHDNNDSTLQLVAQYINSTEPSLSKQLVEYAKRVLSKVAEEIQTENDDDEK
jgi:HEAT repeat protein